MTVPIAPEQFTRQLLTLLEETFEKVHGVYLDRGTSLNETLASLSAEEASRPIVPSGTTVAGHVAHVVFYLNVLEDYMGGKPQENLDWKQSWLVSTVTEPEWNQLCQEVKQEYDRIAGRLKAITDWNDERRIGGAMAILVHTAYHLGALRQIMHATRQK